ncbi:hypothetical protein D3C86_1902260 [compost metagenome]
MPAPGIRVIEIAVQDIARNFIVEADVVVAHHAGIGHGKQVVNTTGKLGFIHAFLTRFLRRNAGHHHGTRLGKIVVSRLTVKNLRLTDDIKIRIGADRRELRRPVQRRAGTKGFVIVEEE